MNRWSIKQRDASTLNKRKRPTFSMRGTTPGGVCPDPPNDGGRGGSLNFKKSECQFLLLNRLNERSLAFSISYHRQSIHYPKNEKKLFFFPDRKKRSPGGYNSQNLKFMSTVNIFVIDKLTPPPTPPVRFGEDPPRIDTQVEGMQASAEDRDAKHLALLVTMHEIITHKLHLE